MNSASVSQNMIAVSMWLAVGTQLAIGCAAPVADDAAEDRMVASSRQALDVLAPEKDWELKGKVEPLPANMAAIERLTHESKTIAPDEETLIDGLMSSHTVRLVVQGDKYYEFRSRQTNEHLRPIIEELRTTRPAGDPKERIVT